MHPLSLDELRWLHATEAMLPDDTNPSLRVRTCPLSRSSQRHRHYHLLDDSLSPTPTPSPRKPSASLIPAPVTRPTPPPPTEWIYRSPKRPPRAPLPPLSTPARTSRPRHSAYHSVIPARPKPLSAKDNEKERSIWAMLGLAEPKPRRPPTPPPPLQRNRASSASSNSTANSTTSAHSASTSATSPSPSVPASPKPSAPVPTKSILSRSPSVSSRPTPQRSLAALFTRGPSSGSVSGSVKSVTFVDEPTVHYPDEYDTDLDSDLDQDQSKSSYADDDLASGLTKGALAWEMGLDIDSMDLDLSLELNVAPTVNLDAPLELDIGQKYVPPKREEIAGILEEDEEAEDEDVPLNKLKSDGLRRFLSLTRPPNGAPLKTERKIKRRSAPLPTRPTISGPFALGSPPAMSLYPFASRSTTSLRSQARSTTASSSTSNSTSTSTSTIRARSNSNSTTDTLPQRTHRPAPHSSSVPSTPIHKHRRRPRTAPSPSPVSTTSSIALSSPRCGPYPSALHTAPSLESFRSAAGRSVRSLGSIKSTASARSAIRALLGKIGIGAGGQVDE